MRLQSGSSSTGPQPRCGASTSPPCSRRLLWCSMCKCPPCKLLLCLSPGVTAACGCRGLLHTLACSSLVLDALCCVQAAHVCGAGSLALRPRPRNGWLDYIHLRHSYRPHRRLGDPHRRRHPLSRSHVARLLLVRQAAPRCPCQALYVCCQLGICTPCLGGPI